MLASWRPNIENEEATWNDSFSIPKGSTVPAPKLDPIRRIPMNLAVIEKQKKRTQ